MRGFMIDPWPRPENASQAELCHHFCELGRKSLRSDLQVIAEFLKERRNDVVLVFLEQYANTSAIVDAVVAAGLLSMCWVPKSNPVSDPNFRWPKLSELISSGKRMIMMTDTPEGHPINPAPSPPWLLYQWDYTFETKFTAEALDDFSCEPFRGYTSDAAVLRRKLPTLNHFLSNGIPAPSLAAVTNDGGVLASRFRACMANWSSQVPSVVALDFWSIHDPVSTIHKLNLDLHG